MALHPLLVLTAGKMAFHHPMVDATGEDFACLSLRFADAEGGDKTVDGLQGPDGPLPVSEPVIRHETHDGQTCPEIVWLNTMRQATSRCIPKNPADPMDIGFRSSDVLIRITPNLFALDFRSRHGPVRPLMGELQGFQGQCNLPDDATVLPIFDRWARHGPASNHQKISAAKRLEAEILFLLPILTEKDDILSTEISVLG